MNAAPKILRREDMSREDWLAWRRLGIGGSDAAAVMGESDYATPFELFLEKTGRIAGRRRSYWEWKWMNRGLRLEAEARRAYQNWTGVSMPPRMVVHPEFPQLRVNLDGDNEERDRILEIKVPGMKIFRLAQKGKIPRQTVWQCRHGMMIRNRQWCDYWAYNEDEQARPIMIERDPFIEKRLMERELEFWECVRRDRWPPKKIFMPGNVLNFRR